jgi:enediyne biosynthesis protein E4
VHRLILLCVLCLLGACVSTEPGPSPTPTPSPTPSPTPTPAPVGPVDIELADPCESPVDGFLRLEVGDRGLDQNNPADDTIRACPWMPGGVVASDLDGDGDHDLLFPEPPGEPVLWVGGDSFELQPLGLDLSILGDREVLGQAAIDLDGDDLPEILLVGEGFAASFGNLGALTFDEPELLYFDDEYPISCINSLAVGDIDGDADLDLLLPGLDPIPFDGWVPEPQLQWPGTPDLLLLQDDGVFTVERELLQSPVAWMSMHALFTDRDDDGDLDIFIGSDRARDGRPPASFWRNDGELIDDAAEIGADTHACVMGSASRDFDGDGDRDYCLSDLSSRLRCLVNVGGVYVEGADALGLAADLESVDGWLPAEHGPWSPWSVEAVDLDNDGHVDVATAAGPPPGPGGVADSPIAAFQPDVLWQGGVSGFVDRSGDAGYTDPRSHYGLASADLDHDGTRELILGSWGGPVVLWDNPCGAGSWVEVALEGTPRNRQGFGSRVTVEADGLVDVQEVHGLKALAQSPPELHVGLGSANTVDRIEVRWPDGAVSEVLDLPVNARLTIRHPDVVDP